jgi:CubicO group peptidase (beta-lactamase class C family)
VLLLAEQGKLSLSDPISKYFPELPDYGTPITIDHLLHHTSGLRDWGSIAEAAGWPRATREYSNAWVLDIASHQKSLNYKPGDEWSYTNTGYNLLCHPGPEGFRQIAGPVHARQHLCASWHADHELA